eukprot:COSAG02_NODE_35885_length_462_cov_0.710744_1_plen_92_part_10
MCDYRQINKLIERKSYRLPSCDQLWYSLDKAKYISTADAADGYWLAPLDPETSFLTAVDTPLSDRDARFTGAFWRKLWALHRTSLKLTPAYS